MPIVPEEVIRPASWPRSCAIQVWRVLVVVSDWVTSSRRVVLVILCSIDEVGVVVVSPGWGVWIVRSCYWRRDWGWGEVGYF